MKYKIFSLLTLTALVIVGSVFSFNNVYATGHTVLWNDAGQVMVGSGWSDYSGGCGTCRLSQTTGNYIEYTFTGSSVSVYLSTFNNAGIEQFFIDSVSYGTVDLYSASASSVFSIFNSGTLPYATHTLRMYVTGTKNVSSAGAYVGFSYLIWDDTILPTSTNTSTPAPSTSTSTNTPVPPPTYTATFTPIVSATPTNTMKPTITDTPTPGASTATFTPTAITTFTSTASAPSPTAPPTSSLPTATPGTSTPMPTATNTPLAGGGGSQVIFPFTAGRAMQYGFRGVHGDGDYGTTGMVGIDLVGGDEMGTGIAGPYVYASDAGVVDYVCSDGASVAIRTHNSTTGDSFIYAHLTDNNGLLVGNNFARGQLIGTLKYGSFSGTCGTSTVGDKSYDLYWMFMPKPIAAFDPSVSFIPSITFNLLSPLTTSAMTSGIFQAGSCSLNIATQLWSCGTNQIGTGGTLMAVADTTGGGGSGGAPASPGGGTSFFDYIVAAIMAFVQWIVGVLPAHNSSWAVPLILLNTVKIVLKIAFVLVKANFNLTPMAVMFGLILWFDLLMWTPRLVISVIRIVKSLN